MPYYDNYRLHFMGFISTFINFNFAYFAAQAHHKGFIPFKSILIKQRLIISLISSSCV